MNGLTQNNFSSLILESDQGIIANGLGYDNNLETILSTSVLHTVFLRELIVTFNI